MSVWEIYKDAAGRCRLFAKLFLGTAAFIAVACFWVPHLYGAATVMLVCGAFGFTMANMFDQLANLQAALDMKRMTLDGCKGRTMFFTAGDSLTMNGGGTIMFCQHTKIEVIS